MGQTVSDAAGNFALTNLPVECAGGQLIRYDGSTVDPSIGLFDGVDLFYEIIADQVTEARYARGDSPTPGGPSNWTRVSIDPVNSCRGACLPTESCVSVAGTPTCLLSVEDGPQAKGSFQWMLDPDTLERRRA